MTDTSKRATLLKIPIEIRLHVYHLVFSDSWLKVCGHKFLHGHHNENLPDRGKRISTRQTDYAPAHVCSQLRLESLPILLNKTTLCCCHMGLRLVDTHCLSLYRAHIRHVSVDSQSFGFQYIESLRPDVLHRLCKALPPFPQLQILIVHTEAFLKLPQGVKRDSLQSTHQTTNGNTMFQESRAHTREHILNLGNGALARIIESEDRTFNVQVHTYFGDFHPQDEEGTQGAAVVSQIPVLWIALLTTLSTSASIGTTATSCSGRLVRPQSSQTITK